MTLPTSWVAFNSDGSSMSISRLVSQGSSKAATIGMSVVVDIDMQWCIHTLHSQLHVPMCSFVLVTRSSPPTNIADVCVCLQQRERGMRERG